MKYVKFLQDLLKAAEARDCYKHKPFNYPWFEDEHRIFICPQGHYFVVIPECYWYFDKSRIFDTTPINGKSLFMDNLQVATDTHTVQEVEVYGKKMKLHKFVTEDETIFVDENNLKYFDLKDSTFKGTNRKNPIYIYEDEALVGMVLPVNYS